jgi:hypothetical protein
MNKLLAFVWLVIIGTNFAGFYSEAAPYQGAAILGGAAYFLFVFRKELLRLIFFNDYLLVLAILVVPGRAYQIQCSRKARRVESTRSRI